MRSSILAAAAFFSVAVFAGEESTSTYSVTDVVTITSCAPEVTDCPAASAYPTVYPTGPVYSNSSVSIYPTTTAAAPYPTTTAAGEDTTSAAPYPTNSPAGESPTLSTEYITTCIPTVITSVITVTPSPYPTSSPAGPVGTGTAAPVASTYPTTTPEFTGAAGMNVQNLVAVACAGLLAFLFA